MLQNRSQNPVVTLNQPAKYFNKFCSQEFLERIVNQTNLYSIQKMGRSINIDRIDISNLIRIYLLIGIIKLPSYTDYWSHNYRQSTIAD